MSRASEPTDFMDKTAVLKVRRGEPGEAARYDVFEVPFEDGMSVLDALMWVRRHRDASLAVRYSCINANACKECTALVDGRVVYLCTERLQEGEMTVDPLPKRPWLRDLVTDILSSDERPPSEEGPGPDTKGSSGGRKGEEA